MGAALDVVYLSQGIQGIAFVAGAEVDELGLRQLAAVSFFFEVEDAGQRNTLPFFGSGLD